VVDGKSIQSIARIQGKIYAMDSIYPNEDGIGKDFLN
jgi:hypothetical protein